DKTDPRLRLLNDYKKCIFVPNKLEPECVPEDFIPYDEYFQLMKTSAVPKNYLSEVCIPLKYKNIYCIGYLLAWHTKELDVNGFKFAEKIASSILKDIYYWNLAQEWIDRLEVAYLSKLGLEFYAPNSKNFTKHVKANTNLILDILQDKDYIISARAMVSNITPTEKHFQVGLEFVFDDVSYKEEFERTIENSQSFK
ncbi:MAG: hypothetical protein N3A69_07690, partial [Leptospiraceae bacterium]|nr:hypothetical protein [Leptospiraceae bacterium]